MANMYYENYKNALESLNASPYKGNLDNLTSIHLESAFDALVKLNQALYLPISTPHIAAVHKEIPSYIAILITRFYDNGKFKYCADLSLAEVKPNDKSSGTETIKEWLDNRYEYSYIAKNLYDGIACYANNKYPLAMTDNFKDLFSYCENLQQYILTKYLNISPKEILFNFLETNTITKEKVLSTPIVIGMTNPINMADYEAGIYYDAIKTEDINFEDLCSITSHKEINLDQLQFYKDALEKLIREYAMIL